MHRFVAASRPTSSPRQTRAMVLAADEDFSRRGLLLEMTLLAERLVAFAEQASVD